MNLSIKSSDLLQWFLDNGMITQCQLSDPEEYGQNKIRAYYSKV